MAVLFDTPKACAIFVIEIRYCSCSCGISNFSLPAAPLGTEVAWGPWFVPNSSTLSNKTVTADIQCTTSLNLSYCTKWRFKSTVSAFPPDCNLLARECLNLAWYSTASATLKRGATRRGLWGFVEREGLDRDPVKNSIIRDFDEFRSSMNFIVR